MPSFAELPDHGPIMAGKPEAITYLLKAVNYSTGHTFAQQVRALPSRAEDGPVVLATLTHTVTLVGSDTQVVAHLTEEDTRNIGAEAWTELTVTPSGGDPRTIAVQRILVRGDVTK